MMTVQEMIEKLEAIEDKSLVVCVACTSYAMGSEETGLYEDGVVLEDIANVSFVKGDALGGLRKLDNIDHVEIELEEIN